ncbi:MAG: nucleosidase [Bacteroidota bacterium]|nr:nucleosidase [Bacteroidota bacterium]
MNILVTYAIPQERVAVSFPGCTITYCETGIGKVNALLAVVDAIGIQTPDLILNIGTAGSVDRDVDSIVICDTFVDRDMKKCKDFGVAYHLDFKEELHDIPVINHWNKNNTCNTGDSFVTRVIDEADAFDMENFAVAALCKRRHIPFVSVKYITDKIGENSVKHWEDKLEDAQKGLQAFFHSQK